MKNTLNKCLSLILTICLTLSLSTISVFAEPEEVIQEAGIGTESSISSDQNLNEEIVTEEGVVSDQEQPETDSESSDPTIETEDASEEEILEEEEVVTDSLLEEEEITEDDFEETGLFGIDLTDPNGVKILPWLDTTSNIYYLFLTNAIRISEMELSVTGIRIEKTSTGTLDPKTNKITGAFANSGDGVTLTAKDGKKYNIVVKQSGLPSLSISLNNVTLEQIHAGSKDIKYPGQRVILTDASGNINVSQSDVELKGRGNTTWDRTEKKPYQIKFDKKQSVLGMAKAKKWILLANAFDDSMLRNKVALYAGDAVGLPYTPDSQYVDLWIDSSYRGTYQITEKVEIDTNRLNLTDPLGCIMELDAYYRQEQYTFYDAGMRVHFSLSDTVDENNTLAAMENFSSSLAQFDQYLFNTNPNTIKLSDLSKYICVDDFIKWTLVNEYMSNCESYNTSWYWYKDGPNDVLHLGPLWDFDTSQNMGKNLNEYDLMYGMSYQKMLVALMKIPEYAARTQELFKTYRSVFSGLSANVYAWGNALTPAADGNYIRWKFLGQPNLKSTARAFKNTYSEAIADHATWLSGRDAGFGISVPAVPTANTSATVSDSGRILTVQATNITGTSSIRAAVWSQTNGQDDIKWYDLKKNADGSMSVAVDLKKHGSNDTYYAHIYSGNTLLGNHTLTVTMSDVQPEIAASYNEDTGMIDIAVKGISDYKYLNSAVWTAVNGQDDLRWIRTDTNGSSEVTFSVDSSTLKGTGPTYIHVYGMLVSEQLFVTDTTVTVKQALPPAVTAVQTDNGSIIDITASHLAGYTSATVAVWGDKNSQNDLKWYDLTKQSDGTWTAAVDFTAHKETGLFHIHVYGKKAGTNQFVTNTTITTVQPAEPTVSVYTIKEGEKYSPLLKNASSCTSVSFAVWGDENAQNDIKWYTGKKKTDGTWTTDILIENHKETGKYFVHAYGMIAGKNTFLDDAEFTVDQTTWSELTVKPSPSGKTLVVSLENAGSFTSTSFAIWGAKDGQNDLKWYNGKKNLDGSWTVSVDLSAHKETGTYYIHAYGVKNGKNAFVDDKTITIDAFASPVISAIDRGKSFLIKGENTDDYQKVRYAVWTAANGQDDIKWYAAAPYSDGSYRFFVNYVNHGGNGTYYIHAYGTKGGKESFIGSTTLLKENLEKPSVTATLDSDTMKLTIDVQDTMGYSGADAAVWGAVNGQNDIKWYPLSVKEGGLLSTTVDISTHKESGTFYIHVYGKSGGKQFFMGDVSVNVP